jgi:hypothetical protein
MDIIKAIHSSKVLGGFFRDVGTWASWEAFFKAVYCLPMSGEEIEVFRRATGLSEPPAERPKEVYVIAGRRSGKSSMAALLACYTAVFGDWKAVLSIGEKPVIVIVAVDKAQAGIVKGYCEGIFELNSSLRAQVRQVKAEEIELKNGLSILVKTCNWRSIRGYTVIFACLEETSFWRYESESANRDIEVMRALRPALATTGGSSLSISTPYSKVGLMYEAWRQCWGKPGPVLVWQAPTRVMNPTLDASIIERSLAEDREAALSEWEATWRADLSSYVEPDLVQALVIPGRAVLPPVEGVEYACFVDPSGGGQDSFTACVGHKESGRTIVDCLLERRPPFSAEEVVKEFAEALKPYGITRVTGDRYAGEWPAQAFARQGIRYETAQKTASELYLELLPVLSSGGVELPDHSRLLSQFSGLERRVRPAGKDSVAHGPHGHDDLSLAIAGLCVTLARKSLGPERGKVFVCGELVGGPPPAETPRPAKRRVFYGESPARKAASLVERIRESLQRGRRPPDDD